jgi:hypothetical protein
MERLRLVKHKMRDILVLDLRNAPADEIIRVAEACRMYVTSQPPQSVLTLLLLENGEFTREVVTKMKEVATYDRPHVIRSAFVGAESFPKAYYNTLSSFSAREFPTFETEQEALDWLVQDTAAASSQASRLTG